MTDGDGDGDGWIMKELNQQQMGGKDVAYYDDKHYLDMVLQLLGTRGRLMILMILM